MSERSDKNIKLTPVTGVEADHRTEALKIISELETIQNTNDDIIDRIARQNEAIEAVIFKLLKGGIYYGNKNHI